MEKEAERILRRIKSSWWNFCGGSWYLSLEEKLRQQILFSLEKEKERGVQILHFPNG